MAREVLETRQEEATWMSLPLPDRVSLAFVLRRPSSCYRLYGGGRMLSPPFWTWTRRSWCQPLPLELLPAPPLAEASPEHCPPSG